MPQPMGSGPTWQLVSDIFSCFVCMFSPLLNTNNSTCQKGNFITISVVAIANEHKGGLETSFERGQNHKFYTLCPYLQHYQAKFFQFYRMTVARFDLLLCKLALRLRKKATNLRQPVSPEQMLVLTLR